MYAIPEQLVAFNKSNIHALLDYTSLFADNAEKLAQFQFQCSQAALADSVSSARTLAAAKDLPEFGQAASSIAQPVGEQTLAYARGVQTLLSEVQGEFAKFFDTQVNEFNKRVTAFVDQAAKSAPAGSDVAMNAVKTALSSANQAYDAATKAGKQFAEMTEASIQSVASSTTPANGARKKAA